LLGSIRDAGGLIERTNLYFVHSGYDFSAPGQKKKTGWAKTTDAQIGVRTGPGPNFPIVQWLRLSGTRVQVSDQIRGSEMIAGSALWDKIDGGHVPDRSLAFE